MIDYVKYFLDVEKKRYKVSDDGVDADLLYDIDTDFLAEDSPERCCVRVSTQDIDFEITFDKNGIPNEICLDTYKNKVYYDAICFKRHRQITDIWSKDKKTIERMKVIHYTLWGKINLFFLKVYSRIINMLPN